MTKELLTKENIERDVREYVKNKNSVITDGFLEFFIPVTFIAVLAAIALGIMSYPIGAVAVFIPSVCLLLWYIFKLRPGFLVIDLMSAEEYSVSVDTLISAVEETCVEPYRKHGRRRMLKEVKVLYFASGRWRIPFRAYGWSDTFAMSDKGIFNSSVEGNEFYVVTLHKTGDIVCVYNKKFFEYRG